MDGDLAHFGLEDKAGDPYDIADIQLFEGLVSLLPQIVPGDIALDLAIPVLHMAEGGLAHDALAHDPAGYGHVPALQAVKTVQDLPAVVGLIETDDLKRVRTGSLQLRELVQPDLLQLAASGLRRVVVDFR